MKEKYKGLEMDGRNLDKEETKNRKMDKENEREEPYC